MSDGFKTTIRVEVSVGQMLRACGLGPSINGLVTDGNTQLCCRDFILTLFQSTTAYNIDSEHTRDYNRLLLVCVAEFYELQ